MHNTYTHLSIPIRVVYRGVGAMGVQPPPHGSVKYMVLEGYSGPKGKEKKNKVPPPKNF